MSRSLYAVILAGGSGERFWPISRADRPKQFLAIGGRGSLLEQTVARLDGFIPPERTFVLTNALQERGVRDLLPQIPETNVIVEPAKRDTAPAIALGTGLVSREDPTATMAILPADHVILDRAGFRNTLLAAAAAADETGELVTIGINPTWACPSFGYIEAGNPVALRKLPAGSPAVRRVARFREKPNAELAARFLREGNFRWNSGMFIWTVPSILSTFERYTPELATFVGRMRGARDLDDFLAREFPALPKNSIDYAIMEKTGRVLVTDAAFDWDDVGTWTAMARYLEDRGAGNRSNAPVIALDASDNIVYSSDNTPIALVGVRDLVVVRAHDCLLVCRRSEAEKVKRIIPDLPEQLC